MAGTAGAAGGGQGLTPVGTLSRSSARLLRRARRASRVALDLALPPRCVGCGARVDAAGLACAACWSKLNFIAPPLCGSCGAPFEFATEGDLAAEGERRCASCYAESRSYDRARAAVIYDEGSRGLILGFKHGDRLHAAPAFGAWLARAGAELLADCDIVTPVPLHRWRLLRRRYNQAALIAGHAARLAGVRHLPDLLERHRATPSQGELGASARRRNVAGAFRINPRLAGQVKGARIVLVDDVLTTGATVSACARVLRRGGAARIDVLTLARVVLD
jgi:ComF family protein